MYLNVVKFLTDKFGEKLYKPTGINKFMSKKIEIPKRILEKLYLENGLSSYKIAKIYRCDPSVIQKRLNEYEIPLIHKKEKIDISREKLYDLYINKNLSTYKIAKLLNVGRTTVYNKIVEANIKTRPKKVVYISKKKLKNLYWKKKLSLSQISKMYDCSSSIILDKLKEYKIKRRDASEANTIYPKEPFEEDLFKKAYMIGFRIGDLHVKKVGKNSKIIRVNSSTTKIAQVNLIKKIFGCYGHFHCKNLNGVYAVDCSLHESFAFLITKEDNIEDWILEDNNYFFAFLAGYTDAEGCIKISNGMARYRLGSYDKNLLKQVYKKMGGLNLCPKYNLETKAGTVYGGVKHNGDFWRVSVNNKFALLKLLGFLEPYMNHSAKLEDLKRAKNNIIERNRKFGTGRYIY